jgi:predicted nucleic acid-binding protein
MPLTLVLDASAGVEILLHTTRGESLTDQIPRGSHWWAPDHYPVEVAAALRGAELRGDIKPAHAVHLFAKVQHAKALRRAQIQPLLPYAWRKRHQLSVYDALYVVLAEHLHATLVTADVKLANAVAGDVPTIVP